MGLRDRAQQENLRKQIDLVEEEHLRLLKRYADLKEMSVKLSAQYETLKTMFESLRHERTQLQKSIDNLMGVIEERQDAKT